MFKDKKFNKILYFTLISLFLFIGLLIVLGEKSSPQVISYEIVDLHNGIAPSKTQISLTFNRVMDKDSVEKDFTISPEIKGNFAWIGKKVVFTPKEKLQYGKNYKIYLSQARDSEGKFLGKSFETGFAIKPNSLFYISEEEKSKGQLQKVNLSDNSISTIVSDQVDNYSISPDGKNLVYSYPGSDMNISIIRLKSLVNNEEKELKISNNIISNAYDGIKVSKLLFGQDYVAILGQFFNIKENNFLSGRLILLYDLSTSELKLFTPKATLDDTDTMLFTPDYKSLIYRDSSQDYTYTGIKNDNPITLGRYISINGFNFKQDKLAITDYDPITIDGQYVGFVDKDRNKVALSPKLSFAQEPIFANTKNEIVYDEKMDSFDNFGLYGIKVKDIENNQENVLYFDNNYSSELPLWSPDDRFIAFERYNKDLLKNSLKGNRIIFNTAKPEYGEIVVVNTIDKTTKVVVEKGRDAVWDN